MGEKAAREIGERIGSWLNFAAKCAIFCLMAKAMIGRKPR